MKRLALLSLALCTFPACDAAEGPALDLRVTREVSPQDVVVATFADDRLTAAQLEERFAALSPRQRAQQADPEGRRALVDGVVHFELLAREAARRELHNDPEIVAAIKQLLVRRLLEEEHARVAAEITDADLEAWYTAHRDDFQRPARVRAFHLFLARKDAGGEAALRARAQELRARAEALAPRDLIAFGELVRETSDDLHSRALGGDLRFRSHEELTQTHGAAVADAAFALPRAGALSGWIENASGLHLLRLEAREPALALSLSQPQTRERVLRAVRAARERDAERALLERLSKDASYEIDEARLRGLSLDEAPATVHRRPGRVDDPAAPAVPPAARAR